MSISTAMVMAAGLGTRMRPLTHDRCKALVQVGDHCLIDHMLVRLEQAGVKRAVVNVHAFADRLEAHLKSYSGALEIVISDEREALLETGGGVVKALPLLGPDPILICNIDAIWLEFTDVLGALYSAWNPKIMDELFLLASKKSCLGYNGAGDFDAAPSGCLSRRSGDSAPWVYAGVQIFKPELAQGFEISAFSRNKIWDKSLARRKVYGAPLDGYWMHVGDPLARKAAMAILAAHKDVNYNRGAPRV